MKKEGKSSAFGKPFYFAASRIYENDCVRKLFLFRSARVNADLKKLDPFEILEEVSKKYYVRKIALSLMIIFAGSILALLTAVKMCAEPVLQQNGTVMREQESRMVELEALTESEDMSQVRERFQIEVGPRQMTEEEIQPVFERFAEELEDLICGENVDIRQVSGDLRLWESYDGFPFSVEWFSDRTDVVSNEGTVYECESEEEAELTADITYGSCRWRRTIPVKVVPPMLTAQEQARRELEELLTGTEEQTRFEKEWRLPETWRGQSVQWREKRAKDGFILWIISVISGVLVYFLSDRDLHEKTEKRREKMKREYPDIVHKLVLYMGAGMTVRGAFGKVAAESTGRAGGKAPAYEEMLYTFREIQAGASEGKAYERFGKRSGLQEYIRLAMLLSQNLKKGSTALTARLRSEADRAYMEQLQNGRRMMEEASTKLLLPMGMLLAVVMVIVIMPAFSSMGL